MDDIAKKFNLEVGETAPVSTSEPVGKLGNSPDVHEALFELRPGELSQPLRLDSGYAILTVKNIVPAHQATLAEVHDQVLADYQREKSLDAAKAKAEDLAKLAAGGEPLDKAAKSLNLDVKTSDAFARNGSVPDVGTGQQLDAAFKMPVGQTSKATQLGSNWLVYKIAEHDAPVSRRFRQAIERYPASAGAIQAGSRLRRLPHRARRSPEGRRKAQHQRRSRQAAHVFHLTLSRDGCPDYAEQAQFVNPSLLATH